MESSIMMLDERTDQATRKMLQKVVERKQKYDKLEFQTFMCHVEYDFIILWLFSISVSYYLSALFLFLCCCFFCLYQ